MFKTISLKITLITVIFISIIILLLFSNFSNNLYNISTTVEEDMKKFTTFSNCNGSFYTPIPQTFDLKVVNLKTTQFISKCRKIKKIMQLTGDGRLVFSKFGKTQNVLHCCLNGGGKTVEIVKKKTKNGKDNPEKVTKTCWNSTTAEGNSSNGITLLKTQIFPRVTCTVKQNGGTLKIFDEFHSNFQPVGPIIYKKIRFWKSFLKFKNFHQPNSVLIFGLSSVSSNQARLNLPKTYRLLVEQNEFEDNRNYVKSGNGMVENIYSILSGLNFEQNCLKRQNGTLEPICQLLGTKFNQLNYLTLSGIQDDRYEGVFHISNDYSLNPLLKIYETGIITQKENECFQHNLLVEILSSTSKFIKKFYQVPYFVTIWIDLFVPQLGNALQVADDILFSFFSSILPFIKNTAVIFTSDGGFHDIKSYTTELLDSHFPLLYSRYPSVSTSISTSGVINKSLQKSLIVSSTNIYFTLINILNNGCQSLFHTYESTSLNVSLAQVIRDVCTEAEEEAENEVLVADQLTQDSSSPIDYCTLANIPSKYCFCNTSSITMATRQLPYEIVQNGAIFLLNSINDFIDSSFLRDKRVDCSLWVLEVNGIQFNSTVSLTSSTYDLTFDPIGKQQEDVDKELFLLVKVQPIDIVESLRKLSTYFSARIRVGSIEKGYEMTLIEFPTRIPGIGEYPQKYSKCVSTHRDHKLSSVCYCKAPRRIFGHIKNQLIY